MLRIGERMKWMLCPAWETMADWGKITDSSLVFFAVSGCERKWRRGQRHWEFAVAQGHRPSEKKIVCAAILLNKIPFPTPLRHIISIGQQYNNSFTSIRRRTQHCLHDGINRLLLLLHFQHGRPCSAMMPRADELSPSCFFFPLFSTRRLPN